jgi:mannonate dehydratase
MRMERPELSAFHTPNEYVLRLAARHEELLACASIHPYRVDAVERLDAAVEAGARAVKWLPNSMGIDPDSPRCDAFYRRLAELRIPLITHGGREYAVDMRHNQELGNPLRLRRALDHGARLVVAHCASFGSLNDLDEPEGERRQLQAFDLFMRLFTDAQYEDRLFADISGLTLVNRSARVLRELLMAQELHPRLVNASDYPIPALGFLFSPLKLEFEGFLTRGQRDLCNRISRVNPLLFDFVLKRTLAVESGGRSYRLSPATFETDWLFSGKERASYSAGFEDSSSSI